MTSRRAALLFALAATLRGAEPAAQPAPPAPAPAAPAPAPKKAEKSQWVFSLLPKSFQKNPQIDLTVITEMTDLGKKQPEASPAKPVYYIAQSAGFNQRGHAPGNEKTLTPEEVERLLARALAISGYQPAQPPAHPPTIVIFYTWGSHNLLVEGDDENPSLSGEMIARNVLDRAALVGGEKFASELLKLFQQADDMAVLNRVPPPDPSGTVPPIDPVLGPDQMEFLNPVNQFKRASVKNDFLVDQSANDIYYVVASAYDYASITTRTKRLFWRTRMPVAAQGVSQEQTLPTLITSAAPYFGKEMTEVEILSKRATPEGRVEIGEPYVVGAEKTPPTKEAVPKKP